MLASWIEADGFGQTIEEFINDSRFLNRMIVAGVTIYIRTVKQTSDKIVDSLNKVERRERGATILSNSLIKTNDKFKFKSQIKINVRVYES